jgi:Zn-dependent metalloprotease
MKIGRNFHAALTALVIFTFIFSAFGPPAAAAQGQQQDDGIVRDYNTESGKVSMISGADDQPITILGVMEAGLTDEQRADMLVQSFAPEFGITDPASDLKISEQDQPAENRVTTRYQQTFQGVPVIAGELIVNANDQGALSSMGGEVAQGLELDTDPSITVEDAVEIAKQGMVKWYEGEPADYAPNKDAELWIFDESLLRPSIRPAELVWRIEMIPTDQSQPIRELVLVNAKNGNVPLHFNQIDTAWSDANANTGVGQNYDHRDTRSHRSS